MAESPANVARKRILVVDDTETSRELLKAVLEASGHTVIEANDGIQALWCARAVLPDLIILDLDMAGMDGISVLRELRRDASFANTPIMALTASALIGEQERAILAGFNSFIAKPAALRYLRAEVERLLEP